MDPARALLGLTAAEIWDSDPIHPKADIYNILAKSVIKVELTCGSGQSKRKRSQREGSGNFGGHGGGGGHGGTGAHGGLSHGHQPVRARGDGVGPPMGGRGHRGTVDGEAEVLSGGRDRQVAGGQAGGRVEATTGGEGPSYTSWSSTNSDNIYKRNKNKK